MNIIQWMLENGYAKNKPHAWAIYKGLDLYHEPRFWKRVKRVILYRRWRTADAYYTKKDCFEAAKRGERPEELELS